MGAAHLERRAVEIIDWFLREDAVRWVLDEDFLQCDWHGVSTPRSVTYPCRATGEDFINKGWEKVCRQARAEMAAEARRVMPPDVIDAWLSETKVPAAPKVHHHLTADIHRRQRLRAATEDAAWIWASVAEAPADPAASVKAGLRLLVEALSDRDLADQLGLPESHGQWSLLGTRAGVTSAPVTGAKE